MSESDQPLQPAYAASARRFLFLQGPHGPFFETLARHLMILGHGVRRIHFNGGDLGDWDLPGATAYNGALELWSGYLRDYLETQRITDIVLCGCWRPVHYVAIMMARGLGLRVHGFEEGLLRPHWITLDPRLPCEQAAAIRKQVLRSLMTAQDDPAQELPSAPVRRPGGMSLMIRYCMRYYANYFRFKRRFTKYRTHRLRHPMREWKAWGMQILKYPWRRFASARALDRVMREDRPFFLLCLQLDGDSQIRRYSEHKGMNPVMDDVLGSFARHAPAGMRLVVKNHPLDSGLGRHEEHCRRLARTLGIADRVVFLSYGPLGRLVKIARGMVTVNSTSGLQALQHGCPVKTLGQAVYNIQGLVDSKPLDDFWNDPAAPDPRTYRALRRILLETSQHPGHFHIPACHEDLARSCARAMLAPENDMMAAPRAPAAAARQTA